VEKEGGFTKHFPDSEEMTIYEAAMSTQRGRAAGRAGRQGIRIRIVTRLAAKGTNLLECVP